MKELRLVFVAAALAVLSSTPALAAFTPTFGTSWDPPGNTLQDIVNAHYGPGVINVATDYIGHDAGDVDPWYWLDDGFSALIIVELAGNANQNVIGWYMENGVPPVIDDVDDGVVFTGPEGTGTLKFVPLSGGMATFGFYMNPNGSAGANNAPEPEKFFTNRLWNDLGPSGSGAVQSPLDGDCQALVFDVSAIVGTPNTWLVAWEDLDSGAIPGACCGSTDNDYNDFVMEVTAVGATPAARMSFGAIKRRYAK